MRVQRSNANIPNDNRASGFIDDIQDEINENGIKNAICIALGDNNELKVITANPDNSIELAGIIDLGKTVFHDDIISDSE